MADQFTGTNNFGADKPRLEDVEIEDAVPEKDDELHDETEKEPEPQEGDGTEDGLPSE